MLKGAVCSRDLQEFLFRLLQNHGKRYYKWDEAVGRRLCLFNTYLRQTDHARSTHCKQEPTLIEEKLGPIKPIEAFLFITIAHDRAETMIMLER
jgi:hypothetical protein